jgi:bacillithiol biosynthesis cysteine-adding enzyme BshC
MTVKKIDYNHIPQLAGRDLAYINQVHALRPFYQYSPHIESFRQVIEDKKRDVIDRDLLVNVLKSQYANLLLTPAVEENLKKLSLDNAFTVVTAHQPSLFTGPLYYIFKIISTINLAKQLQQFYPENHFVPVFISSGEDHDFAEVNHLHLFNKTLTWESGETGATGRMRTASLAPVLETLKQILGDSENASRIFQTIYRIYTECERYDQAAFTLVHELFKEDGLIVINMNDARLKRQFIPVIKEEIFNQPSFRLVNETISKLEKAGFPAQAAPREINFFYLEEHTRERIVLEGGVYRVLNTNLFFTPQEMEAEIENHPERFSPNVIMRPLYQEKILPNLAYIGGGGELAYWLERKEQFRHFGLNFPVLVRRNSALWVDANSVKKMEKLGLGLDDFWAKTDDVIKQYLKNNAEVEFHLTAEKEALELAFRQIAGKTESIDPTLVKTVWAEHAKALKSLEQIETRLVRAEKQRHETAIQQIRGLKEKLFPGNGLQERYDNFLPFYVKHGESFFTELKKHLDPLESKFVLFLEA